MAREIDTSDDLLPEPWKQLVHESRVFFMKFYSAESSCEFLITDLTSVWYERIGSEEIAERSKKLNRNVEVPISKLLDHLEKNLDCNRSNVVYGLEFDRSKHSTGSQIPSQQLLLSVTSKLADLPFVWQFRCLLASQETLTKHLTAPLLSMVGELCRRQQELIKVIKDKDKEIGDYKAQGAHVSRKQLETTVFDESVFQNTMRSSVAFEKHVKSLARPKQTDAMRELYVEIMTKYVVVGKDPLDTDEGVDAEDIIKSTIASSQSPKKQISPNAKASVVSATGDVATGKSAELLRREMLEKRLQEEEEKNEKKKKKKKIGF